MAWIKRNLYFVISVVIGLGVTGYGGLLLYSTLGRNRAEREKYTQSRDRLGELERKEPVPNEANIALAKADEERVREFLADFRKSFADLPTPPKVDNRGFQHYLQQTINQFGQEATNAGVGLTPGYTFSFREEMGKLTFAAEDIGPWMQQLEEMKAILHVLYAAKIHFLEHIRRPAVSSDDMGEDVTQLPLVTNTWGVITTYKLEFRGFSAEVGAVLAGFAHSSNCFMVKTVTVSPSRVQEETLAPPAMGQGQNYYGSPGAPYMQPNPYEGGEFGRGLRSRMLPRMGSRPQPMPVAPVPAGPAAPEKILSESPLFIVMYVDVMKLKAPETPKAAAPPGRAVRARTPEH